MISNSSKRLFLKALHIFLIFTIIFPLLPRPGLAMPLPVKPQRDTSVDEAFEALNAEFERYFTEAQRSARQFEAALPFGGGEALEQFGLPTSASAPSSPWDMLPEGAQTGSEGLNRADEGSSVLPQPLDPNAQNASLLEALLPQLAEMPPDETDALPAPIAPLATFANTPTIPATAEAKQAAKEGTPPADAAQMIALQSTPPAVTPTSTPPAQAKAVTPPPSAARDNLSPDLITIEGGSYTSPDKQLSVTIPEQLIDEPVRLSYSSGASNLPAAAALSQEVLNNYALFTLNADQTRDNAPVEQLRRPIELRLKYDDAHIPEREEKYLRLRGYNQELDTWYPLPTGIDSENNIIIALTTQLTTFALLMPFTPEDPCAIATQLAPEIPFVALPPPPRPVVDLFGISMEYDHYYGTEIYISGGDTGDAMMSDPTQLEPLLTHTFGELTMPEDTWTRNFTENVHVTDEGELDVTQGFQPEPDPVPPPAIPPRHELFPVELDLKYLNTSVNSLGSTEYWLIRKDIRDPVILQFYTYHDGEGGVNLYLEAYDNCAIGQISLTYSNDTDGVGGSTLFEYQGAETDGLGLYLAQIQLPTTGLNTYEVQVDDMADYDGPNSITATYSEQASNSAGFGMAEFSNKCAIQCGCAATCGVIGDPVNTAYGNFTTSEKDVMLSGIGDTNIEIERSYNSLAAARYYAFIGEPREPIGIFGLGWTSPFQFEIEVVDPLPLVGAGIKINYPDGHSARYAGTAGALTPLTPGESNNIVRTGNTFVLTDKNTLSEYHFELIVDPTSPVNRAPLVQKVDPNGNTITYTPGAFGPTQISNSAGRTINLTYNGDGLLTNITGPEGLALQYGYTGLLLTSFTDERSQSTTYEYDGDGRLTAINTPKGHPSIRLTYYADGRLASQIVGATETYNFTYNDGSFERTITDSENNSEIHQYDADYRLTSLQDARGYTESYTYNAQDLRETLTDKEGRTWSYSYDARSNLLRTDGPLGWYLEFTYNAQDRPLTMTDAEGRTTNFAYDGAGNLTTITNADADTMTITYDRGLPETITDFNDNIITNTYNAAGDLEQVENGENEILTMAYDGLGRMTSMTTDEGSAFSFAYDSASDLLTTLSGPLGYSMGYSYDANGNLASETDARSNTTTYSYDESENLVTMTDALSGVMNYSYDSMNNLLSMSDELAQETTYEYDESYNLTDIHAPENRDTAFEYDGVSNLTRITDGEGRDTTLAYDDLDRLTDITDALSGVTTIAYDLVGNITSINDANSHLTTYLYDELDRLTDETNAESELTHYDYDDNGNLIAVIDAETNQTALTYDAANRLTSITNAENEIVTFAYDSLGNISDLVQPNTVPIHWEYDALYRPVELTQNYQPAAAGDAQTNVTYQFEYDLNGNLELVRDPLTNESTFEYDALNRLTRDVNALGDDIVYEYDAVDNLISVTDRRNNPTELSYDEANRLTDVTDALAGISSYSYDRVDNLTTYADENTHTTLLEYDDLNRLERVTNPESHAIELAYDAVGNVTEFTDARQASTTLEYDDVNRLIRATDALNGETELQYDEVGNVTRVWDANDHVTTIGYDLAYRTTTITDAEAYVTRFEYDDNGNITLVEDGNSNVTEVAYDALDRILSVTNAENETTAYTYDPIGNLIDIIENDGVTKRYGYDDIYRLSAVTLNHNGTGTAFDSDILYQYGYDANGNLTSITDPLTHITTFQYDELNRMTRESNPLANRWDYNYDPADNLIERIDGNNNSTTYDYYPDDQLQTINYDDGTSVAFEYDPNNNLTQMVDSLGSTNLSYDELNRLSNVNDALGRSLAYGYDPVGNLTNMTYPHGGTVQYGYFDNDWLQTVTDTAGRVTTYERNGVGQMTNTVFANGAISTSIYDDANRLRSITHSEDGGELISSYSYTLNDVGLRTSAEIAYGRPWPKTVTESYEYDGLRRLTGVTDDLGFAATYDYDQVGNRTRFRANDDQTTQEADDAFDITYSYNEANQLLTQVQGDESTTYSYDANGNRTNKHWTQSDYPYQYGTDYAYDREDRLTSATNYRINDSLQTGHRRNKDETRLAYDGMGRRLSKEYIEHDGRGRVAETEYVFDGLDVVAEYPVWEEAEFVGRNNHRNEFYYNDNMQIVSQRRFPNGVAAQNYNYHYDGRMNVVSLTEDANRAWVHYQYDAYGQELPEWGNTSHPQWHEHNQYKVTGKEWDENLGMSYFGSRHYEAEGSVWLGQDTYRGELDVPTTLHRYQYVGANPNSYFDMYGFKWCPLGKKDDGSCKGVGDRVNDTKNWVNDNKDKIVKGVAVAGAVVGAGALIVASGGLAAPAATIMLAGTIGGAGGASLSTVGANTVLGRDPTEDLFENTMIGASIGFGIGTGGAIAPGAFQWSSVVGANTSTIANVMGLSGSIPTTAGLITNFTLGSGVTVGTAMSFGGLSGELNPYLSHQARHNFGLIKNVGFSILSSSLMLGYGINVIGSVCQTWTGKGPYSHLPDHSSVEPGKKFTQTRKKMMLQENIRRNGGVPRSDTSGQVLVNTSKNTRGITPPSNEAAIDHIHPKARGGSNSNSNGQVLSRQENTIKSDH